MSNASHQCKPRGPRWQASLSVPTWKVALEGNHLHVLSCGSVTPPHLRPQAGSGKEEPSFTRLQWLAVWFIHCACIACIQGIGPRTRSAYARVESTTLFRFTCIACFQGIAHVHTFGVRRIASAILFLLVSGYRSCCRAYLRCLERACFSTRR